MTDPYDGTGTTRSERSSFETELTRLIDQSRRDNIPLHGVYDVRSPHPDEPDYTIEISELTKRVPTRNMDYKDGQT